MAVLSNGLETLELGATAWRLIINSNIEKLYSKIEADSTFVKKSGSTMTGFLTLHADPTANAHPATKQYVDGKVTLEAIQDLLGSSFGDSTSVDFTYDDTNNKWTASVIFGTTATTVAAGNHTHTTYVEKAGSTMTGFLTLHADPTDVLHPASKQYVDGKVTLEAIQDLLGSSFTDSSSLDFTYDDATNTWTASVIFGTTATTVAAGNHKHNNLYSATLSTDLTPNNMDVYDNFYLTLGANITINNPTNHTVGQSGKVVIKQDATGSRLITWGSYYLFPGGTEPTLSTVANSIDTFEYIVISSTEILITNFSTSMS